MLKFNDLLSDCDLHDTWSLFHPEGKEHTWCKKNILFFLFLFLQKLQRTSLNTNAKKIKQKTNQKSKKRAQKWTIHVYAKGPCAFDTY